MAGKDDDILISVSTDLTQIRRQLRELGQSVTASTAGIQKTWESTGRAIDKSIDTSGVQKRINDLTGVAQRAGKEWQGALANQAKAMDDLRKKYSPLYAAQQQYLANLKDIKAANAVGAISTNEMAAAIVAEKAAFAGRVTYINTANKSLKETGAVAKLTSNQMLNLSRQGNDVITMFALGAPPMQIFASQAGQIYDALEQGPGGIKGSLKAVGEGVLGLATKFPLATAAIGAAGVAFVAYEAFAEKAAKSVDEILKEHEENIKRLGPAYDEAIKGIKRYEGESANLANLRFRTDAADALKRRAADAQTAIENIVKSEGIFSSRFKGAKDAIDDFIASIKDGNPQASKFAETIASLRASGAITESVAQDLLTAAKAAVDTEQKLRAVSDRINDVAKALADMHDALSDDMLSPLSRLSDEQTKYVQSLIDQLQRGQITAEQFKESLASLARVSPDYTGQIKQVSDLADQYERAKNAAEGFANTTPKTSRVGAMDRAQAGFNDSFSMWRRFGNDDLGNKTPQSIDSLNAAIKKYTDDVVRAESRGIANAKNPNSTATGTGQFIESTWLALFRKYYPEQAAGMGRDAILALRKNADYSYGLIQAYAKENASVLQRAGVTVNEEALQLAHFLGAGDAAKVLKAASGTPLAGLISPKSIAANPAILGGGKTVDDVINYAGRRVSGGSFGGNKKSPDELFKGDQASVQRRIDLLNAQYQAQQQLNPLIKDYGFQVEQARIYQDLLNDAQKRGVEITPEMDKGLKDLAANYAAATAARNQLTEAQQIAAQAAQQGSEFGKEVLGGFIQDLKSGKSAAEALAGALNKVADKLLDMALNSAFGLGPGGNGTGGPLSFLGTLFGGLFRESGGPVEAGQPYIVGEKRPELFVPNVSGRIVPRVPTASSGGRSGGGGASNDVVRVVLQDDSGRMADVADQRIKTHSGTIVQIAVQQSQKTTRNNMGAYMSEAQARQL